MEPITWSKRLVCFPSVQYLPAMKPRHPQKLRKKQRTRYLRCSLLRNRNLTGPARTIFEPLLRAFRRQCCTRLAQLQPGYLPFLAYKEVNRHYSYLFQSEVSSQYRDQL